MGVLSIEETLEMVFAGLGMREGCKNIEERMIIFV